MCIGNARVAAEDEQFQLDTWQEEKTRSLHEQRVKACLRGKDALAKERLKHVSGGT